MASRSLDDLKPEFRERADAFLGFCAADGLNVLVYCTVRLNVEQARIFRQGRGIAAILRRRDQLRDMWKRPDLAQILMDVGPQESNIVRTQAAPGQSLHIYGYALDAAPLQDGKLPWLDGENEIDNALWAAYGAAAHKAELVWAGKWPEQKREKPHVQMPGIKWEDLILLPHG